MFVIAFLNLNIKKNSLNKNTNKLENSKFQLATDINNLFKNISKFKLLKSIKARSNQNFLKLITQVLI